jgi:hypothetical protein
MFGSAKPVVLDRYGHQRRKRLPRWLVLLVLGVGLGAAGVLVVQQRYLPPRLSAQASTELRQAYEQADAERARLQQSLTQTSAQLAEAQAAQKSQADELVAQRSQVQRLRDDLASTVEALPPDPRSGSVAVRAARFSTRAGQLAYDVVLTRERGGAKALNGLVQVTVSGESARGADTTVTLKPLALVMETHEVLRGSLALPEGLRPREARLQVLSQAGGTLLGMRVLPVR